MLSAFSRLNFSKTGLLTFSEFSRAFVSIREQMAFREDQIDLIGQGVLLRKPIQVARLPKGSKFEAHMFDDSVRRTLRNFIYKLLQAE